MTSGIVSDRYAKAFFRYTQTKGSTARVCEQARRLLKDPSSRLKLELELEQLTALLVKHKRMDYLRLILNTYIRLSLNSMGVKIVQVQTAVPVPDLEEKLRGILSKYFSCDVAIESRVDASLIGGFVVTVDNYLLDASIRRQLESIRRQFVKNNNRLV